MLKDLAYEDAKTLVKLAFKKHRDYINGLSYSDYQEFKKRQKIRMEHECEKLSTCCGAGSNEYIDEFCNACNEYAEFECNECEDNNV